MKRKLLLALVILSALVCLFAITASAEKIDGIEYTLNSSSKTATFAASNRTECTLTRVVIPETVVGADGETYTVTSIADRSIGHQDQNAGNQYIEYLYVPNTVTYLGAQFARNCYSLKEVKMDASVTKLDTAAFWSCTSLETLDLSGMTSLTTINNIASGDAKLKNVMLPDSVTSINEKAFQSCGITSLVLPSNIQSIGNNCFQSNKIQTLVLPASLTSVGGASFHSLSTVQTLVFANTSFDGWSTNVTFTSVNPTTIFFAGSDPKTLTDYYTQWASYSTMSYTDYLNNPSAASSKTIVYGTENCTCGYIRTNEEPVFNFTSFTEEMTISKTCAHCQRVDVIKAIDAMFSFRGFSCAEYADGGMTIGFNVNEESIDEYEAITGKTVNYGVFAVLAETIGKNDIFDGEGKALNGVIAADITNGGFDIFNLKIVGFTSEQAITKLAMGAFVATTFDGVTEYAYMQGEAPNENEKYFFASYEDIYAFVKSKETK